MRTPRPRRITIITLRDELEARGHTVFHAADTAGALALLERRRPRPSSRTSACPGAGGMALLERSIALDPARPVIVMTGYLHD